MKKIAIAVMSVVLASPVFAAPDWSKVPVAKVPVFYPGQSGLEWVLNKKDHSASNQILDKKRPCIKCHDTDAVEIGDKIAAGKPVGNLRQPLDGVVPKGKAGFIPVSVQAAYDGNKIYLRFEWDTPKSGGDKKMDSKNDMKLTVMFEDNKVELANLGGCWATCHEDLRGMPDASDAAKGHAKAKALGWDDGVTKYIKESRTGLEIAGKPRGGWDKLKSDADIEAALKEGKFMDLIQFSSGKGEKAVDGYVLDSRHMGGGKSLIKAEGKKSGNHWTVVFERTLAAGGPGDHVIAAGKLYNIGFAIHDDNADGRFHHVSLGYTLGLDNAEANFNAVKQ
ncbi:MAG: ethylbenzene dehydrogenase-related protein [Gallionella sp.]|nr:ethylbenzene dehydrogenase-related protein [Gallionella sp.]